MAMLTADGEVPAFIWPVTIPGVPQKGKCMSKKLTVKLALVTKGPRSIGTTRALALAEEDAISLIDNRGHEGKIHMTTNDKQFVPRIEPEWLETQAQVTACHYEFARMNTLTLGIPLDPDSFLISFSYHAHAKSFNGEFTSPIAIAQGTTLSIYYNPLNPQESRRSRSGTNGMASKGLLFAIGVAGSVVLSLVYLAMLHGCD